MNWYRKRIEVIPDDEDDMYVIFRLIVTLSHT